MRSKCTIFHKNWAWFDGGEARTNLRWLRGQKSPTSTVVMYNHYTITVITSATSETPPTSARDTILPDQINNLLQHKVFPWLRKSNREFLHNKAVDIAVNPILAPRPDVPLHSHLSVVVRHIVSTSPKYVIQDDGEVYNRPHHTSNILLADIRERLRQINNTSRCSLTCLDTRHKPIQRSHYREFDASSIC